MNWLVGLHRRIRRLHAIDSLRAVHEYAVGSGSADASSRESILGRWEREAAGTTSRPTSIAERRAMATSLGIRVAE